MTISTLGWIVVGVAAWVVVAAAVGVLIGGMIRRRDRQVPTDPGPSIRAGDDDSQHAAPPRMADRGRPPRS